MADTITAANAVFQLILLEVFGGAPQTLQQYAADAAFDSEELAPTITEMGVDGFMAIGYNPQPFVQGISLQANSSSGVVFDEWSNFQRLTQEAISAQGFIILPGIKKKFTLINGALTGYVPVPSVGRMLQARKFKITWGNYLPVPYSAG